MAGFARWGGGLLRLGVYWRESEPRTVWLSPQAGVVV
jgi:hypothetical protein